MIPYDGVDDAIAIANDSEYGLGGSVWTSDPSTAEAVARRVQTGSIGINHYMLDPAAPFGGVKASGLGRELGPEGLAAYLQLQSIYKTPPPQPDGHTVGPRPGRRAAPPAWRDSGRREARAAARRVRPLARLPVDRVFAVLVDAADPLLLDDRAAASDQVDLARFVGHAAGELLRLGARWARAVACRARSVPDPAGRGRRSPGSRPPGRRLRRWRCPVPSLRICSLT